MAARRSTFRRTTASAALFLAGITTLSIVALAEWIAALPLTLSWLHLVGIFPSLVTAISGVVLSGKIRPRLPKAYARAVWTVGIASGTLAVAIALVSLEPGRLFRYDATTGLDKSYRRVITFAGISGTGICRCAPDKTARMSLPGGFETQVSIYDDGTENPKPGLIIVHGNTWLGSNLSTYRSLARNVADKGFFVLTLDFPGFGKSDDPFSRGPSSVATAYDRVEIVNQAVRYLIANTPVDRSKITVFGHSGGTEWALRTAVDNPDVAKVAVMVAPPPAIVREHIRAGTPEYTDERSEYFARRFASQYAFIYGKNVPTWFRWDQTLWNEQYTDSIWDSYTRPDHKPILLILAERDEPSGHESVRATFASLSQPKNELFLLRSDHYLNTAQSLGLVFYDAAVLDQMVSGLVAWLNYDPKDTSGSPAASRSTHQDQEATPIDP